MLFAKASLFASILSLIISCYASAQGDFFFTFEEGGQNQDQSMNFGIGDTGSLYIYWSTNGPADSDLSVGAFIDVLSSNSGVIEFTAAQTFDFEVKVNSTVVGNRWLDNMGGGGFAGPSEDVSADFIDEMAAFTVTGGVGIRESNNGTGAFIDCGYEEENDGFLWGRIDFNVVSSGITEVLAVSGDGLIVNGNKVVPAEFTTATIVVPQTIPEPSTSVLLLALFSRFLLRRNGNMKCC